MFPILRNNILCTPGNTFLIGFGIKFNTTLLQIYTKVSQDVSTKYNYSTSRILLAVLLMCAGVHGPCTPGVSVYEYIAKQHLEYKHLRSI